MNASNPGSADWWAVVLTMPLEERLATLQDYRAMLIEQNTGRPEHLAASALLSRVNTEIKRANRLIDNGRWWEACRRVLPQDLLDAVIAEKRRLSGEIPPVVER